jgi:hypothetical protein
MRSTAKLLSAMLLVAVLAFACACGSTATSTTTASLPAATSATLGDGSTSSSAAAPTSTSAPGSTAPPASATLPDQTNETAGGDVGSARDNPVPVRQEAQVGDWKVKVVSATLNANGLVASQNEFNPPPAAENQFVLVRVEATRTGEGPVAFLTDIYCAFVGSSGTTFEAALAHVPDNMKGATEVAEGASITGNLVFEVASDQVAEGVMYMEQALSFQVTRLYFALQ